MIPEFITTASNNNESTITNYVKNNGSNPDKVTPQFEEFGGYCLPCNNGIKTCCEYKGFPPELKCSIKLCYWFNN